jgi:hypothetical protein
MFNYDIAKNLTDDGGGKKKSAATSGGFDIKDIPQFGDAQESNPAVGGAMDMTHSFDQYGFQPKTGADNDLLRAQNQGTLTQIGKTIGNTASNIVTGVVRDLGALGSLAELGDHRDYSNWLTEAMDKMQNPLGEVYREHPEKTMDFHDPAWYIQQIGGLFEGAGKFGVEAWLTGGMGGEGLFGSLAKAAGGSRLALGAAQVGSAATIGYAWAAESAGRIYKQSYAHNYQMLTEQGMDPAEADKQAQHVASQSAASTAQIGTVFNTLFGLTAIAPLFKKSGADALTKEFLEGSLARQEGESLEQYNQRLKSTTPENSPQVSKALDHRNFWSSYPSQAVQMAGMGLSTQYAEKEGERVSEGKDRPLYQQLTDFSQMIDDNTNEEGALNLAIGFLAGPLHAALLDRIPSSRLLKYDENGNPIYKKGTDGELIPNGKGGHKYETKLVTAKTRDMDGGQRYFENVRDAITKDIDKFQDLHKQLSEAVAKKDEVKAQQMRDEIFAVGARDAVAKGITKHFQQTFREIAALDNTKPLSEQLQPQIDAIDEQLRQQASQGETEDGGDQLQAQREDLIRQQAGLSQTTEAMQKGFAKDMNDHEYKQRALGAVADLEHLQHLHDKAQSNYADPMNPDSQELADHLFFRESDLYLRKRALDRYRDQLDKEQAAMDGLMPDADVTRQEVRRHNDYIDTWNRTMTKMDKDIDEMQSAVQRGDTKTLTQMVAKYRAQGLDESDLPGAVRNLVDKIKARQQQYQDSIADSEQKLKDNLGYNQWQEKNPGKKVEDFLGDVHKNSILNQHRANLEAAQSEYDIAADNFREASSDKGRKNFLKQIAGQKKELISAINDRNRKADTGAYLRQKEREGAAELDEKQKAIFRAQNEREIAEKQQQLAQIRDQYNELMQEADELKQKGSLRNAKRLFEIRREMKRLKQVMDSYEAQINTLNRQQELLGLQQQQAAAKTEQVKSQTIEEEKTEDKNADIPETKGQFTIDDLLNAEDDTPQDERAAIEKRRTADLQRLEKLIAEGKTAKVNTEAERAYRDPKTFEKKINDKYDKELAALSVQKSPEDAYYELVNTLPQTVIRELDRLENEFRGKKFSYNTVFSRLGQYESAGLITGKEKADAAVRLEKYLEWQDQQIPVIAEPKREEPEIEQSAAELISEADIPQIPIPSSPVINLHANLFNESGLQDLVHANKQMTINAVKGNYSSFEYREIKLPNGNIVIRSDFQDDGGPVLDPKVDKRLMIPGMIGIGDGVNLRVDTDFNGTINNDEEVSEDEYGNRIQREDRFSNYTDENGKIIMDIRPGDAYPAYANMPVKIVHDKTGAVTYLPRVDWITAQQKASNYRNVANEVYDAEGQLVTDNNVALQVNRVLAIRRKLAEMHNMNPASAQLKTRVADRTDGQLMFAGKLNKNTGKVTYITRLTDKMLPDGSLKFVILKDGKPYVAHNQPFSGTIVEMSDEQKDKFSGAPGVAIPLPNGKYRIVPLATRRFEERQGDIHTIARAIELYMKHGEPGWDELDQKHLDLIDKTGRDITTERGLNDFINQYYTHTNDGFSDMLTQADAKVIEGGKKSPTFMLSIPNKVEGQKKALIKVGVSFSGQRPIYAQLKGGKLEQKFVDALTAGISKRFKNVTYESKDDTGNARLNGINSQKPIAEVRINKDGTTWSRVHDTYNDYLKTFTETSVYGKHQADGKYIYAGNSQVTLNDQNLFDASVAKPADIATASPTTELPTEGADEMMQFESMNLIPDTPYHEVISPNGEPLSLESLRELHSFTDDGERNTKTPEEVHDQLTRLGITHIAEGYNPFIKC